MYIPCKCCLNALFHIPLRVFVPPHVPLTCSPPAIRLSLVPQPRTRTRRAEMGRSTLPVCAIVIYALLGIDGMAVEIENPFGYDFNDLPLGIMCDEIALNMREVIDRHQVSQGLVP